MQQVRVVYDAYATGQPGNAPTEHPLRVMQQFADELGFKIIGSMPRSIGDCWWFWIEYSQKPSLPAYIHEAEWLPVGSI
jgi:hypothetical protein